MADFRPLLRSAGPFLAGTSRAAVCGLVRALEEAARLAPPFDPGRAACDALVAELQSELGGGTPPPPPPVETWSGSGSVPPPVVGAGDRLAAVRTAFLASPEVAAELPGLELPAGPDTALWRPLQFALLRLSPSAADRWREKVTTAAGAADPAKVEWLPGPSEQVILPGFAGTPGVGMRPSIRTHLDLDPVPAAAPAGELASVLTALLWWIEADATLQHGLRGVFNYGLTPLTAEAKRRYRHALLTRWGAFRDAPDAGARLEAWVDLDEAVHSLMHHPPAAPGSWWAAFHRRARDTMIPVREAALDAGRSIQLWEMAGRYADNRAYADSDDQPMPGPLPVGHIVACLRLYLEIDGRATRGRVFFRDR